MNHPPAILTVKTWSDEGPSPSDPLTRRTQSDPHKLCFASGCGSYRARVDVPGDGTLVMNFACPRPFRLSVNSVLVSDQPLFWRSFQRQIVGAVALPVKRGELELLVEVGDRPRHPEPIDRDCPSRNRDAVMRDVLAKMPDGLDLRISLHDGPAPAVSARFEPFQFRQDGIVYQHVLLRDLQSRFSPPTQDIAHPGEARRTSLILHSSVLPRTAMEITDDKDRSAGLVRFAVPVAEPQDFPAPLRKIGVDPRPEPAVEIARWLDLRIDSPVGGVTIAMPGYETLGRNAPRKQYRELAWPKPEEFLAGVPLVVLPASMSRYGKLYRAAWEMFLQLLRFPKKESGVVNSYISTGAQFGLYQFVWDSSFTTMAASYGWRTLPVYAQLDNLYSRQFDGGYIHREHNWDTGMPEMFEPDFSPNPPIMTLAEWQAAKLNGNLMRLREAYPALKANHQWIYHNRRLPDGTFWTTGLANGLDNSPSLGDGYPDLSAQMAHEAEVLAGIAQLIGNDEDAQRFHRERQEIGDAVNRVLWSDSMRIYSTSLPGGGHNPNKVVTAFWPLWAGIVPSDRVEVLAGHLLDPKSFWRHHPIPSLAADSPHFKPDGNYWLGSTWAPTNYAAIKGFDRSGRHDLAVKTTLRHLDCMSDVLESTGQIWENYCSERSDRGNWSGSPYCWSALGPISLLLEVIIGLEPDALANQVAWTLPDVDNIGVRNYAFGANTLSLIQRITDGKRQLQIRAELPFALDVITGGQRRSFACPAGESTLSA